MCHKLQREDKLVIIKQGLEERQMTRNTIAAGSFPMPSLFSPLLLPPSCFCLPQH